MTINSIDNKKLPVQFCRTNRAKSFLHYQGFILWNYVIPTKIKISQHISSKAFNKRYKPELTTCQNKIK